MKNNNLTNQEHARVYPTFGLISHAAFGTRCHSI